MFIFQLRVSGTTGPIQFLPNRLRYNFYLEVGELDCSESDICRFQKIATWDVEHRVHLTRDVEQISSRISASIQNKTFIVITREGMPFLQAATPKTPGQQLIGNDRYEGFSKDLMEAISKKMGFKYKLVLVADKSYGKIDESTKKWNGMIRELLDHVCIDWKLFAINA